jgi:hypothetical protein
LGDLKQELVFLVGCEVHLSLSYIVFVQFSNRFQEGRLD